MAAWLAFLLFGGVAAAQTTRELGTSATPAIRVQVRQGQVTIRTWNRAQVEVTSDAPVDARVLAPGAVGRLLAGDIEIFATKVRSPHGALQLPAEQFSLESVPDRPHDGVIIRAKNANATITVPAGAALIVAGVGRGRLSIDSYRGGTFIARIHNGTVTLHSMSGSGFVEAARGAIDVRDSSFDRIRARTALGPILFERCRARQIEVSAIQGNVIYDDGAFTPGMARFESQHGNVAIGIANGGSALLDSHSTSGDTRARIGNGGPEITASTPSGQIFFYSGNLQRHPDMAREFHTHNTGHGIKAIPI